LFEKAKILFCIKGASNENKLVRENEEVCKLKSMNEKNGKW